MLKRDKVKYIRDKAKSRYEKGNECRICGTNIKLDFHHFYTLVPLLEKWLSEKTTLRPEHYTDEYCSDTRLRTSHSRRGNRRPESSLR